MPLYPKPFFRKPRNRWYVQIDGRQINLGPDEEEAFRQYHELMHNRGKEPTTAISSSSSPSKDPYLDSILDAFLGWCKVHREARTYTNYLDRLQSLLGDPVLRDLKVNDLKPHHLQNWVDAHGDRWGPMTKRGKIQSVQRALNWAVKQGLIEKSPVAAMEKPPQGKRDNVIPQDVYLRMRELTATDEFRDLIDVAWETGCRPQEIWRVEARHLDPTASRWVFPAKESKGRKKIRIVYLPETSLAICVRLAAVHAKGPLFRNSDGLPWTRNAVSCVFTRMQKHLNKRYALVDFRHSFVTRALVEGVDPVTLSFLLGHADTSMLAKTYAHLGQESGHLFDALNKASPKRENT